MGLCLDLLAGGNLQNRIHQFSKDAVSLFVKSPCSAKEKPALTEQADKRKAPDSKWNQEFWSC